MALHGKIELTGFANGLGVGRERTSVVKDDSQFLFSANGRAEWLFTEESSFGNVKFAMLVRNPSGDGR